MAARRQRRDGVAEDAQQLDAAPDRRDQDGERRHASRPLAPAHRRMRRL